MRRLQRFAPFPGPIHGSLTVGIILLAGSVSARAQPGAQERPLEGSAATTLQATLQQLQTAQQQLRQIHAEGLVDAADRATSDAVMQTSRALQALQATARTAPAGANGSSPTNEAAPAQPAIAPPNIDRADGNSTQPGPSTPGVTAIGSATPATNGIDAPSATASAPAAADTAQGAGAPGGQGAQMAANTTGNTAPPPAAPANEPQQQAADAQPLPTPEPLPPPGITAAQAQDFVGKQVFDPRGQAIGHLRRVNTNGDGQVQSLVIEHGGFLGLFTSRSTVTYTPESATVDTGRFILNLPPPQ